MKKPNKYVPHQSTRECARRIRQVLNGTLKTQHGNCVSRTELSEDARGEPTK